MTKSKDAPPTQSSVTLRFDQWDLIVLALSRVRGLTGGDPQYLVDKLGREFLRRRCDETISEIQSYVPEAGA